MMISVCVVFDVTVSALKGTTLAGNDLMELALEEETLLTRLIVVALTLLPLSTLLLAELILLGLTQEKHHH